MARRRLAAHASSSTTRRGRAVTDVDGNTFLDFTGGIGVHERRARAPARSSPRVAGAGGALHRTPASRSRATSATSRWREALCRARCRAAPQGGRCCQHRRRGGRERRQDRARATPGGAAVLGFEHGFHGRTLLALTLPARRCPTRLASVRSRRRSTASLSRRLPRREETPRGSIETALTDDRAAATIWRR